MSDYTLKTDDEQAGAFGTGTPYVCGLWSDDCCSCRTSRSA